MIDILSLIQQKAAIKLHGRPSRHYKLGMEYHANCALCGTGTDRFCIWPESNHFYCRVCNKAGDAIQFLREYEGLSYREACLELDIDPRFPEEMKTELPLIFTRNEEPNKKWQSSAESFVWRAERYLFTSGGQIALEYLHKRGFTDETLRQARIGFCPDWYSESSINWGITENQTDETQIRIPKGITIPWIVNDRIWKLSIRRPDKSYFQCLGSSDTLYNFDTFKPNHPVFLFESEFDALSAQQESYGIDAAMIATGGTSKGQTIPLTLKLKQASHLIIGFDNDEAGHEGAKHWINNYKASRWIPWSHDMNETLQTHPHLIKKWLEIGLRTAQQTPIESPAMVMVTEPEIETVPVFVHPVENIPVSILEPLKRKVKSPWDVRNTDTGLLTYCSFAACRNKAVAWRSNITMEEAYCEKHTPSDFGWR